MDKSVFKRQFSFHSNHWWFESRRIIFKYLLEDLDFNKKKIKILDYGTGVGNNIRLLKNFSNNISIFDKNKKMLNFLAKKEKIFIYSKRRKYDLIFLTDVLEHIKEDKKIFNRLLQNLNNNGFIFITVPAYQFLFSSKDKVLKHFRRYNLKQLQKVCSNKKVFVKKISYFNFFLFIPLSILILFFKITNKVFIDNAEKVPNFLVNYLMKKIFSFERFFLKKISFPFGLSLLLILKKIN